MLRCALWEMVHGVCDQWESVEQLFDGRGHVENAARRGLLWPSRRSDSSVVVILRHHDLIAVRD